MKHFVIYRKLILIIGTATAVVSVGVFFFMEDILFRTLFISFAFVFFGLFCEVNPIPVKAALNMMGKEVGTLRAPLTEMEDAHKKVLKKAMMDLGIL